MSRFKKGAVGGTVSTVTEHSTCTFRILVAASFFCLPGWALVRAQEGNERFLEVDSWAGRVEVTVTGDGTQEGFGSKLEYRIRRHLDYSFTLNSYLAGTWISCSNTSSLGVINDSLVATFFGDVPCVSEYRSTASGVLKELPAGIQCENSPRALLQIIPIPGVGALDTWGISSGIDGEASLTVRPGSCGADFTEQKEFNILDKFPVCPQFNCIQLPEQGFHIVQTYSYDVQLSAYLGEVPVHYEVLLDLQACGEELEVIVNPLGYDAWRPRGADTENDAGNDITIEAQLRGKGGCPTSTKAARFIFELTAVSNEPGVSMNWPYLLNGVPTQDTGKLDMAFLSARNPAPWLPSGPQATVLETETGAYTDSPQAVLSSFDWGGYATLKVTAEFDDGRPSIVGHLVGSDALKLIPLPKRQPGSNVADVWKAEKNVANQVDSSDAETDPPGDGHDGDGFTLYEEYRGFHEGRGSPHIDGNPIKKDLFILDLASAQAGIQLAQKATGLELHGKLDLFDLTKDRVVNSNRGPAASSGQDQHGLRILRKELDETIGGQASGGPGLPKHVPYLYLPRTKGPNFVGYWTGVDHGTLYISDRASTIAHEILHACNVYHHGRHDEDPDKLHDWHAAEVNGVLTYLENGSEVGLFEEGGGCGLLKRLLPADEDAHWTGVHVAGQGGQHSGNDECVMRYDTSRWYRDESVDSTYWRKKGGENARTIVCASPTGTGVNDKDRCPQSRYGDATAGCCAHQICVNDRQGHEAKTGPAELCLATGGGVGGSNAGQGAAALENPDPTISLSVDESRVVDARRGRPLLVALEVIPPRFGAPDPGADFVLHPAGAEWTSAVRFKLTRGGVDVASWPLVPLVEGPARLVLDSKTFGLASWWVAPEVTATIAPGDYTLEVELDTTSAPEGWQGRVGSLSVSIAVSEEPVPTPPAVETERLLSLALYRVWQHNLSDALELIDQALGASPDSAAALWYRAEVLALSGSDQAALEAYRIVIDAFFAEPEADIAPPGLLQSFDDIQARLLVDGSGSVQFRRGDANADGHVDISDAVVTLGFLFLGAPKSLACESSADNDDSGEVSITDAIYVLNHLFLGTPAPRPPFPACGEDPTEDELPCSSQPACAG